MASAAHSLALSRLNALLCLPLDERKLYDVRPEQTVVADVALVTVAAVISLTEEGRAVVVMETLARRRSFDR